MKPLIFLLRAVLKKISSDFFYADSREYTGFSWVKKRKVGTNGCYSGIGIRPFPGA
jgi:hypothetical protein